MSSMKTTVLVVDDDIRILRVMERILELEGYRVIKVADGQSALYVFDNENPDLVLLDIMLPVMDGYTVCKRIREFSQVPIIMVTAKDDGDEAIEGLEAGVDDYVPKPFSSQELVARVAAVLRRAAVWDEPPTPVFTCDDLAIDYDSHKVVLGDQELDLTSTEYRLLSHLTRNAGRILTPDQILATLWGDEYVGEHDMLRVNVTRLRQKLGEDSRNPRFIVTIHGVGYMFETNPDSPNSF